MTEIRTSPCLACPYRCDVPSGIWAPDEYEKLLDYDLPTGSQPPQGFGCHAAPEQFCHGWAVVHSNRGHEYDLLALRLLGRPPMPDEVVPLFHSGHEAAEHGLRDVASPSEAAIKRSALLLAKHDHLQLSDPDGPR